jgi:hypothetical protein
MDPMEDVMQTLATRFAITASIAALICATPVSLDLVRAGAAGPNSAAHVALALDTAQARDLHGGREAPTRGAAGRDHQASHEAGQRSAGGERAASAGGKNAAGNDIKADKVNANNIRANDIKADDVRVNNVRVNDVNAANVTKTNVNATYVRPPYLARPAAVAATATTVAVGTTVAMLPASCTIVVDDGVTYHHCGDTYYIASNGTYVVVNPPR